MPRKARKKSATGIYHVILRGINKQEIFETDGDKVKFLNILREIKTPEGKTPSEREGNAYTLYAYCLLDNHVHLLIKEEKESISKIMKRLSCAYVPYFNKHYERIGHLFQDRFTSEPCEDLTYFNRLLRYIHQNPVKAGQVSIPEEYTWSSWREYLSGFSDLCDTQYAFQHTERLSLIDFVNTHSEDKCLDIDSIQSQLLDKDALKIILDTCNVNSISEFQEKDKNTQRQYIRLLKEKRLSIRQISRLTGINIGIVRRL